MSTSSAARSFDIPPDSSNIIRERQEYMGRLGSVSFSSDPLSGPSFDPRVYAATARQAARINAAAASDQELETLLRVRRSLLDKQLEGTATHEDLNRLEYVRWSLDRIEDARFGVGLEMLEAEIGTYERFQSDIDRLIEELSNWKSGQRK